MLDDYDLLALLPPAQEVACSAADLGIVAQGGEKPLRPVNFDNISEAGVLFSHSQQHKTVPALFYAP